MTNPQNSCKKKKINMNILGGTVFGTNGTSPWDKPGPVPGTNRDPSLGQTGLFLFNPTVKSPFYLVCPWDGWGFVPGTIVPQGLSEKCLCVSVYCFSFAATKLKIGKKGCHSIKMTREVPYSTSTKQIQRTKDLARQTNPPPPKRARSLS